MTQTPSRPRLPPELDPRGPGRRAPGRRTGRRGVARLLSWLAVVTSVVVLAGCAVGYVALNYYGGRIGRIDIRPHLALPGFKEPANTADGAANFLLVGSDTRSGSGDQGFNATPGSADYVTGQRSDTVMLVHLPAGSAKPTVVSFPRDSWVEIPGYVDPKSHVAQPAHHAKLNAAFALGGPPLLIGTIEQLSGVKVDHYVEIDFAGFRKMVDSLGGVSVCIGTTRHDKDSGDYLTAGVHHINGNQALALVRDRKGLSGGDIDRIRDQQYFLSVMLHKVESAGTLGNPFRLNAFLTALTGSVTVDKGLSIGAMRHLANRVHDLDPAHVNFVTLPFLTANGRAPDGESIVELDPVKDQALFDAIRGVKPSGGASGRIVVPPSSISIPVYNGAGIGGLAARAAGDLRAVGFRASVGGNFGSGAAQTVVRYGPDRLQSAQTVAAAVPGAVLVEVPSLGNSLQLVVGSGYSGARPVTVGAVAPRASAAPSHPASRAPTPAAPSATAPARSCAP